jgi:hypothetical protein
MNFLGIKGGLSIQFQTCEGGPGAIFLTTLKSGEQIKCTKKKGF